MSILIMTS